MKGLELSRAYFERFGRPMLEEQFPELMPFLAAGLCGSGSECFGWDDEVSRDHDFEPGFCLFLPEEELVNRRQEFLLERAYAKLPAAFGGVERARMRPTSPQLSKKIAPLVASASACSGSVSHCPAVSTPSGAPTVFPKKSAVRSTPCRAPPTGAISPRERPMNSFGSFA